MNHPHLDVIRAGVEAGQARARAALDGIRVDLEYPWHYRAFGDLHTMRQIGMAEGPIPHQAIEDYAVNWGLTYYEYEVLDHAVRALDNHRREVQAERSKREADKGQ